MNAHMLDINSDVLNVRRIFWLMVIIEVLTMFALLYGDLIFWAYYFGIIITPLILLLIPVEPAFGIVLMLVATGFDIMGALYQFSSQMRFNLTVFHIALMLTLSSLLLNHLHRHKTTFHSIKLWPPLIAYLLILSVSLIYTPEFAQGGIMFVRILVMCLLTLIILESIDKIWKIQLVIWSMVIVPFTVSIYAIYQLTGEGAYLSRYVVKMATAIGLAVIRSSATFENPVRLACFLMVGIVVAFGMLFFKKQNPLIRLVLILSIIITSAGLLSTFSRGGWLSTFVAVMVVVALHKKWSYYWIFIGFMILTIIILSIKMPHIWEVVFDRFVSIFDPSGEESSSSRISLIKSGIWMWQDHPLLGVGLRGFPHYYYNYYDPNMPRVLYYVNEYHTIQTGILAELGLVGLIISTWLFITVFFHGLRTSLTLTNEYFKNVQITLFSLFIGFIVNFTFASDIANNTFWITIGLLYAIPIIAENVLKSDKSQLSGDTLSDTPSFR